MMELTTGNIVEITGRVVTGRPGGTRHTHLIPINYSKPVKVLVLGKSQRCTGTLVYDQYDYNYLTDIKVHHVWIVMPIATGNHFRRPIAVLPEQIVNTEQGAVQSEQDKVVA